MPDPPSDERLLSQLDDIQANILRGHRWKHARYHFLRIEDHARFRSGLAAALQATPLPSAADFRGNASPPADPIVNVAFSHRGLRALGVGQPFLETFPEAFRQGMATRADRLGDDGASAPEKWDRWLGTEDIHVLVALFFAEATDFEAAWKSFVAGSGENVSSDDGAVPGLPGTRHLLTESGDHLFDEKGATLEHFGFRDGISQPALADGKTLPDGGGWVDADGNWQPIATGEFLLGYQDMDGFDQLEGEPALRALCHNGTFLVFRKLQQHVDAFRDFFAENFEEKKRELAAARMVGRWQNGAPLVGNPRNPDASDTSDSPNDFRYAEDPEGRVCPVGAHVRRINPRDMHPDRRIDPKVVARRRIIRRGFAYGSDSDEDKGLLFVCLNARIDSQFEFLQEEWINRGDFIGEGSKAKDPLVGANDDRKVILTTGPPRFATLPSFVTTRGGEYFFLPGLGALKQLLEGDYGTQPVPPRRHVPTGRSTDPVRHPERLDVERLHQTRELERLRFDGIGLDGSRRQQSWYYATGYDQALEVLGDERRFTVDHNTRRLYELLRDPDRDQAPFETQMLLGLPGGHGEKNRRLEMLRGALGPEAAAGPIPQTFVAQDSKLEEAAYRVTKFVIKIVIQKLDVPHLDVARQLARIVPIQRVERYYGVALPGQISDLQKAWHFRQLSHADRQWLTKVREVLENEGKGRAPGLDRGLRFETLDWVYQDPGGPPGVREMAFLGLYSAIELLIDAYDTGELFDIGRLAIRELQKHLAERVEAAEQDGAPPDTLLARLLAAAPNDSGRPDYLIRVKLLLLELIVGGIETPAKGITNTIDGLLRHPEAMALAREAVTAGDSDALDQVIYELLRLDPVAFLLFRECPAGATLSTANGLHIEPGSKVALVLRHAYRDPRVFSENPSGFLGSRTRRSDDPSFGISPHECVGERIAMAEIRGVVRALLDQYELQRVPGIAGCKQERFRLPTSLGIKLYETS